LKDLGKLSFSKEVAETLGLESAIILELYKTNKISNSRSIDDLLESIRNEASFLPHPAIEESLQKLIKYKFINITNNNAASTYSIRLPTKSNFERAKIDNKWEPSQEAVDILNMSDVSNEFYERKLVEFRLYWIERGQERNNWNSTYIDYIRREWAKERSSNKGLPFTINNEWIPSNDVFDILELSEITKDSASKYLREFILYWEENGSAFTTWNSKFIEHVKRRHLGDQSINNEESKKHSEPGKFTKDFAERKSDTSWASEINLD
jgi:hypothetical protein|tara:strand:- start:4316 stop:5113 length:798 start_codon:yes stop_codon:yes gene_type:complete